MILPDQIFEVKIIKKNIEYYKKLGYNVNSLEIIRVPTEHLQGGSHAMIKVKCDIETCGKEKEIKYQTYNRNISKRNIYACSIKCSQFKTKLTKKEKYGNENYYNVEQYKKTCLNKYGVENVFQLKSIKESSKQTKENKYGDPNFNNVEKRRKTNLKNHGVLSTSQLKETKEKSRKTNLKNNGVEYPMQSDEIKKKSVDTCLEHFDVKYSLQSLYIREKGNKTKEEKYGDKNYNNREKMIETKTGLSYDEYIEQLPEFKKYEREVLSITKKQPLYLLKNYKKRGIAGQIGAYHLDHKFTIYKGFENVIPPYILGNIINLGMLTWEENCSKHRNCSLTKQELFDRYDKRKEILKQLTEDYNKTII